MQRLFKIAIFLLLVISIMQPAVVRQKKVVVVE